MPGDPNNPYSNQPGPNRTYDNGPLGVGQNDFQREAGNFTRQTPGFGYQGTSQQQFNDIADQYRKRGSMWSNMGLGFLGNNDPRRTSDENAALSQLALAASGQVPSAAQMQMQRGMEQSVRDQASAAAGARGGPGAWAAAQRLAANNMAGAQQDVIGQSGQLRAQEMAQARDAYARAAAQQRQGDLSSLGLNFQTGLGLGGLGNTAEGQNIQAMMGLYGLGQGAAGQQFAGQQAYNQWIANMAQHTQDQNFDQQNRILGSIGSGVGAGLAAASDIRMKKDIALEGLADVRDRQVSPYAAPYSSKKGDADPMALIAGSAPGPVAQYREAHPQRDPEGFHYRAVWPSGAKGMEHAFGEAPLPATPAAQMLEAIAPVSFTYKADPTGQRRYGVMAQDLEKSPMGASLVRDTPSGKMVDAAQGTMAALHALADMHERVKRLEGTKQEKR